MSRTVSLKLGGEEYEAERLPAMRAVAWRKRAEQLLSKFPQLATLYDAQSENMVTGMLAVLKGADEIVPELVEVVLAGLDLSPDEREDIYATAFEEEFMEGLQRLLLLNAPLSALAARSLRAPVEAAGTMGEMETVSLNGAVVATI